jgi:hypothetical protein
VDCILFIPVSYISVDCDFIFHVSPRDRILLLLSVQLFKKCCHSWYPLIYFRLYKSPLWILFWASLIWLTQAHNNLSQSETCVTFRSMRVSCGEGFVTPCSTPKVKDHPLSAIRDNLLNTFVPTLHIWRPSLTTAIQGRVILFCQGTHNTEKTVMDLKLCFKCFQHLRCLCMFVGNLTLLSVTTIYSVGCWDELWIGKDLEGIGCGLNEVLSRYDWKDLGKRKPLSG